MVTSQILAKKYEISKIQETSYDNVRNFKHKNVLNPRIFCQDIHQKDMALVQSCKISLFDVCRQLFNLDVWIKISLYLLQLLLWIHIQIWLIKSTKLTSLLRWAINGQDLQSDDDDANSSKNKMKSNGSSKHEAKKISVISRGQSLKHPSYSALYTNWKLGKLLMDSTWVDSNYKNWVQIEINLQAIQALRTYLVGHIVVW